MCCQFFVDDETKKRVEALVNRKLILPRGEIHPTNVAAVILGEKRIEVEDMAWGFHSSTQKNPIINCRAETAHQKRLFSDSYEYRRCVIPASYFYEWDRTKQKVSFSLPDEPVLFMAGIYKREEDRNHFTVLTMEANEDMLPVHDRMPMILKPEEIEKWLFSLASADRIRNRPGPRLKSGREFEQLSLL